MNIDRIGERILQKLHLDGRITNAELAAKVGLSPSACLRRVQELERTGVIKGYRVSLDSELVDRGFIVYVSIGLSTHTRSAQKEFEDAIALSSEVSECHNVTGEFEYLLRIETKDIKAYKAFHADTLGILPYVATITTHVVMDSPKDERS
ncbi:AsnC family transcriptional regulator [Vibrio nigripulchritudo]|nr:AsnC family transcriptional regulator [Vibrio nigripulchritudo]BDU46203.1 AsnC family transcriptional regulator [Vibrio nigripulchritudo]